MTEQWLLISRGNKWLAHKVKDFADCLPFVERWGSPDSTYEIVHSPRAELDRRAMV